MGPGDQLVFPSSERFDVVGELGRGGMGVVYEVRDRDRQVRLALKGVRALRSKELLRLKTEFRAARDLIHPNLVRLGELFEQDGACFFTMELVAGVHLLRWLRPPLPEAEAPPPREPLELSGETRTSVEPLGGASRGDRTEFASAVSGGPDEARRSKHGPLLGDRLRPAFRGLVTGVAVLHRAGLIHRDIKPSNVLVEESGRVVLLDFGVVTTVDTEALQGQREIVGTYAYMAPEQATGADVGPAADWYAVGVVLFEALTGRLPFAPGRGAMHAKVAVPAPSVRALAPDAPADLAALCERLLRRDPSTRPLEKEILAAFGIEAGFLSDSGDGSFGAGSSGPFVGRDHELAALTATFDHASRQGAAACAFVTGESGIGKSVLMKHVLGALRERRGDLLVLHGRCDEREIIPYNAFDGVVDGLARHLGGVPPDELRLPDDVSALVRLFPVLRGVEAIGRAADRALVPASPWTDPTTPAPGGGGDGANPGSPDLRSAAFAALAELLAFVASRRHVVLAVDDVHWADLDSLALLAELMSGPEAPPVFLLATARQAAGAPPCPAITVVKTTTKVIALGGLDATDAARLLRALAPDAVLDGARTAALIEETRGHPLFLAEMMRRHAGSAPAGGLLLDDALWQRTGELATGARGLLEIVALASTSLELGAAAEAAGLPPERFAGHLAELRAARLVRLTGTRDRDAIEPYHDRVREAVAARLPAPRRAEVHRILAEALEQRGGAVEVLAYHFSAAGERARAAGFAEAAARRALASLAFDRAAVWLRTTIDLGEHTGDRRRVLFGELGETLARAGRTADSARAFLEAAAAGSGDDARELRRRAAEQFLTGGHLEDGLATARVALEEVGLSLPEGTVGAASRLGWYRVRLGSSRLRWRPRDPERTTARERMRIDLCWSVGCGLSMVDSIRGAVFALRGPLLAMPAGDPTRIARANAAAVVAASGMGLDRMARRLLEATRRAAAQTDDPLAAFYADLAGVFPNFYLDNDWRATASTSEAAAARWGTTGRGHAFELDVVEQHHLWSLYLLGELAELRRRVPSTIRAAQRIGNRFVEVLMRTWFPIVGLSRDDPEAALADVADAIGSWLPGNTRIDNPFYFSVRARTMIALYRDVASLDPAAVDAIAADWTRVRKSLFARLPVVAVETHAWTGLFACARARAFPAEAGHHLADAARSLARLRKQKLPATTHFLAQLEIAIAAARGDLDAARARLELAIPALDERGMRAIAAAARMRLGGLLGGDAGRHLARDGERYFEAEGIARPDRLVETAFPAWPAPLRLTA